MEEKVFRAEENHYAVLSRRGRQYEKKERC